MSLMWHFAPVHRGIKCNNFSTPCTIMRIAYEATSKLNDFRCLFRLKNRKDWFTYPSVINRSIWRSSTPRLVVLGCFIYDRNQSRYGKPTNAVSLMFLMFINWERIFNLIELIGNTIGLSVRRFSSPTWFFWSANFWRANLKREKKKKNQKNDGEFKTIYQVR